MTDADVVLVMLRRPDERDPEEKRSDPFWEFGSFGCTRCHQSSLMNPRRLHEIDGYQFAFCQGGGQGHD